MLAMEQRRSCRRRWRYPMTEFRFLNEGRRIASADFSALGFD